MARTTAPTNRMRAMTPATDTTMMTRVLTPPPSEEVGGKVGRETKRERERERESERGEGEGERKWK